MAGSGPSLLALPEMSADGKTNLLASGPATLRFWFAPDWASKSAGGNGPGAEVRLLETGAWSSHDAVTRCSLIVEADGNALRLDLAGSLGAQTIARGSIQWNAGEWHQVAIVSSAAGGTYLYVDGQSVASGTGLALAPTASTGWTNGFSLGSDVAGGQLAQGSFDELMTFARVLAAGELAVDYQRNVGRAALGPIDSQMAMLSSGPEFDNTNGGSSVLTSNKAMLPEFYGCALWLEIKRSTNNSSNVVVTLHNTIPGTNYTVLSKTNLTQTSWTTETNITGASGQDWTQVTIPKLGRSNLFFMASVTRSYSLATNFAGMDQSDTDLTVADTMGAIGPNHFVEMINGAIAVFNRTNGSLLEQANITNFFGYGTFVVDPRILYDHQAQRWVACAVDVNSSDAVLAVTTNSSPLGMLTNWIKYRLYVARAARDTDFTTLGLDANGIYVTVHHRSGGGPLTNAGHTIVAVKKPEIFQGTLMTNYFGIDTNSAD